MSEQQKFKGAENKVIAKSTRVADVVGSDNELLVQKLQNTLSTRLTPQQLKEGVLARIKARSQQGFAIDIDDGGFYVDVSIKPPTGYKQSRSAIVSIYDVGAEAMVFDSGHLLAAVRYSLSERSPESFLPWLDEMSKLLGKHFILQLKESEQLAFDRSLSGRPLETIYSPRGKVGKSSS